MGKARYEERPYCGQRWGFMRATIAPNCIEVRNMERHVTPEDVDRTAGMFAAMDGIDSPSEWREAVGDLVEAVKAYESECANPVPDYTLKARCRKKMFAALERVEAGESNG